MHAKPTRGQLISSFLLLLLVVIAVLLGAYLARSSKTDTQNSASSIDDETGLISTPPGFKFNQRLDIIDSTIVPFFQYTPVAGVNTQATVDELISTIEAADYRIVGALNRLAFKPIEDALIDAANSGVEIKIVVEDNEFNKNSYKKVRSRLEGSGIEVKLDRPGSNMHNKFLVFDDTLVWVGSTNITSAEFYQKTNDSLFIDSSELAIRYIEEFTQMFVQDRFSTDKLPGNNAYFEVDENDVEIYFSPKDRLERHIVSVIEQAQEEVLFSTIFFTSNDIANALIDAKDRGVSVKGVWSRRAMDYENTGEDSQYLRLCSNGIDLKISYPYFENHSKYIAVDPNSDDPKTITGSYNWTGTSEFINDENIIIFEEARLVDQYYDYYSGTYESLPEEGICRKTLEI